MSPEKEKHIQRLVSRRKARRSLLDFTTFTKSDYRVNWHHKLMCEKLDEFIEGENKRLIISCPPRHGKSELVSRRLPAYILGRNPDCKIIACSYSSDLASLMNRDIQRIICSPEYEELFPDTKLNSANVRTTSQENYLRNSDIFEIVGHKGVYRSSGVGGSITGMGGNCLTGDTKIITTFGVERLDSVVNSFKYNKWHNNGYRVLSYDHFEHKTVWRRIKAARSVRSPRLLEITSSLGYKIRVTPEHRIFIHDKGYTEAHRMQPGDRIYYCDKSEKQSLPVLRDNRERARGTLQEMLSESPKSVGCTKMLDVWERVRKEAIRISKMVEKRIQGRLLFKGLLKFTPCGKERKAVRNMRNPDAWEKQKSLLFKGMQEDSIRSKDRSRILFKEWWSKLLSKANSMPGMWNNIQTDILFNNLLFKRLRRSSSLEKDERRGEFKLQRWIKYHLYEAVRRAKTFDFRERRSFLRCVRLYSKPTSPSHKRDQDSGRSNEFNNSLQTLSHYTPPLHEDTISSIKELGGESYTVYDIQVEGTNNFFANSILVHNCLIVDDPLRSRADAESPTIRQKTWEWYSSTFRTRRQKNASILVTATRWHENDLTGRLLELAENNPTADQWEVINLPAISEEDIESYDLRTGPDQALWPDEYPLDDLLATKASSTVYEWLSLYQQRPSAIAGNLVKKEQFKYCSLEGPILDLGGDKRYLLSECRVFQTCDPAASTKTSADYFVLGTWVQTPKNDLALVDLIHTRLETPDQVPLFWQQFKKWRPGKQWVGTKGLGISLFQLLKNEGLPVDKIEEDVDKVSRFIPAATRIATGCVYFRSDRYEYEDEDEDENKKEPWLHELETELLGFPNAAHDDMVDITSMAVKVVIDNPFRNEKIDLTKMYGTRAR